MNTFNERMQVRIYYEDTDHGGVVYYANYLKFMERGRTEFLRLLGLELDAIEAEFGVLFAVTEAHVRYHASARFNQLLDVETSLTRLGGAGIAFSQRIYHGEQLLVSATISLACINRAGRASRIPIELRSRLKLHLNLDSTSQTNSNKESS